MTDRIVYLDPDPHAAVQKLLPWYVSGRLDAVEHAEVETHVASCSVCRAELEFERTLHAAIQSQDPVSNDADPGWAAMLERVNDEAPVRHPRPVDTRTSSRPPDRGRPMPWIIGGLPAKAWAMPAALSAALAIALVITLVPMANRSESYRALAAPAEDDATAVVRFRANATEDQIRHSLNLSGARLVDGPTVTDAYIVRVPRERYAAALDTLRAQPAVSLVEALEGAGAR